MTTVYMLQHKHFVDFDLETGEEVFSTCLLGFFSSERKCHQMIEYYLIQPGFKDYPNGFVIEKIKANVDDFNSEIGDFLDVVFYLSHEYYDGAYDHISDLGYYASYDLAKKAKEKYLNEYQEYYDHPDGFYIEEYAIDKTEWLEGFFIYR